MSQDNKRQSMTDQQDTGLEGFETGLEYEQNAAEIVADNNDTDIQLEENEKRNVETCDGLAATASPEPGREFNQTRAMNGDAATEDSTTGARAAQPATVVTGGSDHGGEGNCNAETPCKLIEEITKEIAKKRAEQSEIHVPEVTNMKKVLGLAGDALLVRRIEVVRKAMEELAMGLKFFVLMTMVYSSTFADKMTDRQKWAIRFSSKLAWDPEGKCVKLPKEKRPVTVGFVPNSKKQDTTSKELDPADVINEFLKTAGGDLRVLLDHVKELNSTSKASYYHEDVDANDYYSQEALKWVDVLKGFAVYFSHSKGVVPCIVPAKISTARTTVSETPFGEIVERDNVAAESFFEAASGLSKALMTCKFSKVAERGKIKQGKRHVWVQQILPELHKHAVDHLSAVEKLRGVHDILKQQATIDLKRALLSLQDLVDAKNESAIKFCATVLWTRYEPADADAPPFEAESVKASRYRDKLVLDKKASSDSIGLHGCTNVDLVSRMLDLTLLALRRVLSLAAHTYATDHFSAHSKDGGRNLDGPDVVLEHVVEQLLIGKSSLLLRDDKFCTNIERNESRPAVFFKVNEESTCAFESFGMREDVKLKMRGKEWSKYADFIQAFVQCDANLGDARFVARFLANLKHPEFHYTLFPLAWHMVHVRDRLVHGFHLCERHTYSVDQLHKDIAGLRELVSVVVSVVGGPNKAELRRSCEMLAMDEMSSLATECTEWRARQGEIRQMEPGEQLSKAKLIVTRLLKMPQAGQRSWSDGLSQSLSSLLAMYEAGLFADNNNAMDQT